MIEAPTRSRLASRAAANLVAVVAVSAIFGLKAHIDAKAYAAEASRSEAKIAAITGPVLAR
jgi:hypothetical protein